MHHHHCHESHHHQDGTLTAPASSSGWHSYSARSISIIIMRMALLQRQKHQHHHHHHRHHQGGTLTNMQKTPSLQNGRSQLNYKLIWHRFTICIFSMLFRIHPCLVSTKRWFWVPPSDMLIVYIMNRWFCKIMIKSILYKMPVLYKIRSSTSLY